MESPSLGWYVGDLIVASRLEGDKYFSTLFGLCHACTSSHGCVLLKPMNMEYEELTRRYSIDDETMSMCCFFDALSNSFYDGVVLNHVQVGIGIPEYWIFDDNVWPPMQGLPILGILDKYAKEKIKEFARDGEPSLGLMLCDRTMDKYADLINGSTEGDARTKRKKEQEAIIRRMYDR